MTGQNNPEIDELVEAYERLFPNSSSSWPGMGVGIAAIGDRARRITVPVIFGSVRIELDTVLGFSNHAEFEQWALHDRTNAARAYFAASDILDLSYGTDDLRGQFPDADRLWRVAGSNLEDVVNTLVNGFSLASVIQPISLLVELSLKAGLVTAGIDAVTLRSKPYGHNLVALASKLAELKGHRDDAAIMDLVRVLPDYVGSRYADLGLTRLRLVDLALGAQFVAASVARRFSSRDMASLLESDSWPGPRANYYTL